MFIMDTNKKWEKSSYNLIDVLFNSEATSSLRDSFLNFHFMTHEQKSSRLPRFRRCRWKFKGYAWRCIFGLAKGSWTWWNCRIFGGCSGATSPTSESMPCKFKRRPCRKSGKRGNKKVQTSDLVQEKSATLGFGNLWGLGQFHQYRGLSSYDGLLAKMSDGFWSI